MKYLVYALSLIVVLTSCKKLQDVQSSEDKLRDGKWQMTAATATFKKPYTGEDTTTNLIAVMDTCKKDDYLVFGDNYNGYLATSTRKCTPGEPEQLAFNWGLQENDTKMYIYNAAQVFGTPSVNATLPELGDGRFTMKYYYTFEYPSQTNPNDMIQDTIFVSTTFSKF